MDYFSRYASAGTTLAACGLLLLVGCQDESGAGNSSMEPPGLLRIDADAHSLSDTDSRSVVPPSVPEMQAEPYQVVPLPPEQEPIQVASNTDIQPQQFGQPGQLYGDLTNGQAPRPLPPVSEALPQVDPRASQVQPLPSVDPLRPSSDIPQARFRSETRPLPAITPENTFPQEPEEGPQLGLLPPVEPEWAQAPSAAVEATTPLPVLEDEPRVSRTPEEEFTESASSDVSNQTLHNSPAMRAVARESAGHVRKGFVLANRGAFFSARSEFIKSLRLISQALDSGTGQTRHSKALAAGLRALSEADDFVPRGTRLEADMDVASLLPAHRTPVMKNATEWELNSLTARRKYYTYAQEQLALAAGSERAGSMALYGLARVQMSLADRNSNRYATSAPRAMALHQAALLVDQENYMAANELGVMLARYGQYEHARALLTRSLSVAPQATTWNNLAVVHRHLGEKDLAKQATQQASALTRVEKQAQASRSATSKGVVWTDPRTFTGKSVASGGGTAGRR